MDSRLTIRAAICGTAVLVACLSCASLHAQDQTLRIRVPSLVGTNASSHFTELVHDETDGDQVFAWQDWQVSCSAAKGAVLTFQTDQAFTNTANSSIKRNVSLQLRKNDAPRWSISKNKDQTDYAQGDEVAVVSAQSNRASNGAFQLRVTFLEEQFINTLAGDYDMNITCTIVPK